MENWEEIVSERTSFELVKSSLVKLAEAAVSVSFWEYAVVAFVLAAVWLYRILEFHFLEDCLRGFRGEVPLLHYNLASRVAEHILPKCKNLTKRFCATSWLSSPHLQIAFLHFNGHPPQIKYRRELYVTADEGTIALDWVEPLLGENENGIATDHTVRKLDESPVVIIIPGLTSDSNDSYVKHIAYSTSMRGWRTLVVNHRGLGGVSITSDQFYNAGWTEDLRRIINHIHRKCPQASLFTIGTSIGANILVKYLGEEGASTPVGAAAAVCCPWDLLVCNRFLFRKGIQKLYNRVLAFGLVQHHAAIGKIAEWRDVVKSKSIYDVDHHFTRHTGKYETVDTYYRRTCSADYLTRVAVPLLCFSALDDPICTKEAIPWDEVMANPNVIMVITRHGSHLAYLEGLTAQSIWWVRALTDYMTAIIPSNFMHIPQKVTSSVNSDIPSTVDQSHEASKVSGTILKSNEESDVDKAPYLSISSSGQVAAEDLHPSSPTVTGEEDLVDGRNVKFEHESSSGAQEENALGTTDDLTNEAVVTLGFKNRSELTALQSALSQLLLQLQESRPVTMDSKHENAQNEDARMMGAEPTAAEALVGQLKQSAVSTLQESSSHGTFEVSVGSSVVSALKRCRGTATNLALASSKSHHKSAADDLESSSSALGRNLSDRSNEKEYTSQVSTQRILEGGGRNTKAFDLVAAQNRRTLWLLAYIALVTTCPLIGSALFMRWRRKIMSKLTKGLLK